MVVTRTKNRSNTSRLNTNKCNSMKKLFLLIPVLLFAVMASGTVPSTDFSGGYSFVADEATLDGYIELNTLTGNHYLRYFDRSPNGTATWEVSVTKPCLVSVTLNMFDNSWNYSEADNEHKAYKNGGHTFKVRILDGTTPKDSVAEASESSAYTDIPLSGQLYFEKAGTYKVELLNSRGYSKCGISGITLTAESIPETDFASAYAFVADAAELSGGNDASKFLIETSVTPHYIRYHDHSQPGPVVKWKINATRACYVNVTLNFADNTAFYSGNKHIMEVQLCNAYGQKIDSIAEGPAFVGDGFTENGVDKTLSGTIAIPSAGIYIIKMLNNRNNSKTGIYGVTLSYAGGAVQNMPGTTEIDECGYAGGTRSDGKFTLPGGTQDKGWMKWNVAFASSGNYNVFVKINSGNGKKFKVALQDAKGDDIVTPLEKNGGGTGTPVTLEMGAMYVPAGNYTLKLTNNEAWSDAEWISVQFVRAGGGLIDIPGDITFDEVILSTRALIDNDSILFTGREDAGHHNSSEYAKWNIHATASGQYKFTINAYNPAPATSQRYRLTVLATNEIDTIATVRSAWDNTANEMIASLPVVLEEGNYIFKVQNTEWGSLGRLMSASASYEGGAVINIPNAEIPFIEAILSPNATRDASGIHFNGIDQYAKWNIHAIAGVYTFTFDVVGTNYGKYKLDINQGTTNVFTYTQGKDASGQVTISNVLISTEGDYELQMANVNSGANGYITTLAATADETIFIVDENATDGSYIVEGTSGKKPLLNRTFKGGMYNTICVPFDSYHSELASIFGADYELLELESAVLTGNTLDLNFTIVAHEGNNFSAGKPYLIKPTQDVVNPKFSTHTIHNYTSNNTKSCANADFIGSFVKGTVPAGEANLFLGPDDLLYFSNSDTPIKGTRAYFHLKGISQPQQVIKRARIVTPNYMPTEIELVKDQEQNAKAQKLIENGQLYILYNGTKYNVQGQVVKQ